MMVLEAHVLTERIAPVTPGAPKKEFKWKGSGDHSRRKSYRCQGRYGRLQRRRNTRARCHATIPARHGRVDVQQ